MRNFLTIFKREFSAYFNAPTAYIYLIIFLLMTCGLFMATFFVSGQADMRSFFSVLPFFLAVFIPAISMRLWAEERKLGTLKLLLSFPMSGATLVLGKYAASLVFYAAALVATFPVPFVIAMVGDPDLGAIAGGYLGAFILGGFFLAIGIFISAFFRDQIVTLILSIVLCFTTFIIGADFVVAFLDGWVDGLGTLLRNGIGAADHYYAFSRGVVELTSLGYFLVLTIIFLILNTYTLDSFIKLKPKGRFYISLAFLLAIGIAFNLVLSETRLGRWDLTEGNIYTISDATKKILSRLESPVEVNYYVSPREKLPSFMKNLQQDVKDQLADFARVNPNFVYHIYNPLADPAKLEELGQKGVAPFQAQSIDKDSLDIKSIYSAITVSYLDQKTEVLPRIVPQGLGQLEYQLMSKIYRMTLEEKPIITMVAPIEEAPAQYRDPRMREFLMKMGQKVPEETDNYSTVMEFLRQEGYAVARRKLTEKDSLPSNTKTLLLVDHQHYSPRQIYEISRYLSQGGNVVIASQRYRFQYGPGNMGAVNVTPMPADGNVEELTGPYGVTRISDILMDANSEVVSIKIPKKIGGMLQAYVEGKVKFPVQIRISPENLNQKLAINNRIVGLFYIWGGALKLDTEKIEKLGLDVETVFTSSPESWFVPLKRTPLTPAQMDDSEHEKVGPQTLAVRISGQFPDLFAGKAIPPWSGQTQSEKKGSQEEKTAPPVEPKPGTLVFLGCADMFSNRAVGVMNNGIFFLNVVDSLSLGDELISVRSKSQTVRGIRETSPGQKLFYRFISTGLAPLILIIFGAMRLMIRRRRRDQYQKSMSEGS